MAGPSVWGLHHVSPHAVRANGSIACVVPLHMMGSSFVRTGNVAPLLASLITPHLRGLLGGGWVGGLVSGGWPCTFAPRPRIQLVVKDR